MTQEKKKGVDWLQDVSSDDDEDIVEDDNEEQNERAVVETVQNDEGKKQKPAITPFNEKQHVRNKNTKRIKGGFKAELAQKKVTHLKAMKNPFDVGASDIESGNEYSQNEDKQQSEQIILKLGRNEGETQADYQARVKQHEQKEKQRILFLIQEKKKLDQAIQKANKLNEERAAAKAAKKQKKKKQEDQNINALLKQIQNSQKATPTENADKKKKKKQKIAKEVQSKPQISKDQVVTPVQQQIIQQVMKRKVANSTANKGNKKKPDLGAAKREIQSRNAKQKTKKTDLDL